MKKIIKKKLIIGITCYPSLGGSGILATELGHELAKRGHQVHFISYGIPFRLNLSLKNIFFHEVSVNEYELFRYPDYTMPLAVKMYEVSMKYNLDILHVHYAVPHATAAFLAKQMIGSGLPHVITTLHGTDITLMGYDASYKPIIQYSIENSCGVTAVSKSLRDETKTLFSTRKHIEVIYNFFNPKKPDRSRDEIRKELGVKKNEFLVSHASNLRRVKRIPDLLEIIAGSKNKKNTKLLIVAGSSFSPYQPIVLRLKLEKNIIIKERLLDIENYIHASDLGIYTSDKESFGLAILEAMSYGIAVLATSVGGVPEVVQDKKSGYLYPVGDVKGFISGLDCLFENRGLAKQFGERGKYIAKTKFSTEKIIEQYIMFYKRILCDCD